jgi:hypothetical protein
MGAGASAAAGLASGLLGGLFAAGGSILGAREKKKAFRRFRKRQRIAIDQAREFADERVAALTGEDSLIGRGINFLKGTFDDPAGSPLADQLRKSIQVAQESRGLRRSTIGAVSEARALGAFTQKQRQSLLPELVRFGTVGENLRQSIISFEMPLRVGAATGLNVTGLQPAAGMGQGFSGGGAASSALNSFASGFLGAGQIGMAAADSLQRSDQNASILNEIRAMRMQQSLSGPANLQPMNDPISGAGFAQLFGR